MRFDLERGERCLRIEADLRRPAGPAETDRPEDSARETALRWDRSAPQGGGASLRPACGEKVSTPRCRARRGAGETGRVNVSGRLSPATPRAFSCEWRDRSRPGSCSTGDRSPFAATLSLCQVREKGGETLCGRPGSIDILRKWNLFVFVFCAAFGTIGIRDVRVRREPPSPRRIRAGH